jgi:hypothetical protein
MPKTLLNHDKKEENKQIKIYKLMPKKEIFILIYKSEIDKAVQDLKQLNKLKQYYEPDHKLLVERYKDTILDDYEWYERLK